METVQVRVVTLHSSRLLIVISLFPGGGSEGLMKAAQARAVTLYCSRLLMVILLIRGG